MTRVEFHHHGSLGILNGFARAHIVALSLRSGFRLVARLLALLPIDNVRPREVGTVT